MFANEISPYDRNTYHGYKPCYSFNVAQMGHFYVEPGGFQGTETRFYLPSFLISGDGLVGMIVTDKYLQFRNTLEVLKSGTGQIYVFSLKQIWFVIEIFLSKPYTVEDLPCASIFRRLRVLDPEILSDTDIITIPVSVEPSNPLVAHELPVGDKTLDTFLDKKRYEFLQKFYTFFLIGVRQT